VRHVPDWLSSLAHTIRRLQHDRTSDAWRGWTTPAATEHMMSGQDWVLTREDLLVAFGLVDVLAGLIVSIRSLQRQIEVQTERTA
jgi:hypothetical protein